MPSKTIICLANSRKRGGYCIAGKVWSTGEWIRPVSNNPHQELTEEHIQYENGEIPKPLDIITIHCSARIPHMYQTENWLIDENFFWENCGRLFNIEFLDNLCDELETLWENGFNSTLD